MRVVLPITLEEGAFAPEYQTDGSAGMDVRLLEDIEVRPMERVLARTGLRMAIPPGFEVQVRPRSGLAIKKGITLLTTPGTIDSDYRGELKIILINLGSDVVQLLRGERVAQLVAAEVARADVEVVGELQDTVRGEGGFGSTGTD